MRVYFQNMAHEVYPTKVYYGSNSGEDVFVNYWYQYAASWSPNYGLSVYLNGVRVGKGGENPEPTRKGMSALYFTHIILTQAILCY